jgi:hypothetical protein
MILKKYKKEILLIVVILSISCVLLLINRILFAKPAGKVEISVDGKVIQTLDLTQDTDIVVEGYNGGTNRIVIKSGKLHVSEATCPDKICVHQGWVEHTGENIVCLPNHMIARIISE